MLERAAVMHPFLFVFSSRIHDDYKSSFLLEVYNKKEGDFVSPFSCLVLFNGVLFWACIFIFFWWPHIVVVS